MLDFIRSMGALKSDLFPNKPSKAFNNAKVFRGCRNHDGGPCRDSAGVEPRNPAGNPGLQGPLKSKLDLPNKLKREDQVEAILTRTAAHKRALRAGDYWNTCDDLKRRLHGHIPPNIEQQEPRIPMTDRGGLVGLLNIGNTCFLNSVLQCLTKTLPLTQYILGHCHEQDINEESETRGALIRAYAQVTIKIWTDDAYSAFAPKKLKQYVSQIAPRFIGRHQQDAEEFLVYLLQGLHEDLNRVSKKNLPKLAPVSDKLKGKQRADEFWKRHLRREDSAVADFFVGQLQSTIKCTKCNSTSSAYDPFWILQLAIPKNPSVERRNLVECLDFFTTAEHLDGSEKVFCAKCKDRMKSTKQIEIQRFPLILVVQLKRFDMIYGYGEKDNTFVEFPMELVDMKKYRSATALVPKKYVLYGVVNHFGSLDWGHYTAIVKHPKQNAWFEFDDSRVMSVVDAGKVVRSAAYLLFYESESVRPKDALPSSGMSQQTVSTASSSSKTTKQTPLPPQAGKTTSNKKTTIGVEMDPKAQNKRDLKNRRVLLGDNVHLIPSSRGFGEPILVTDTRRGVSPGQEDFGSNRGWWERYSGFQNQRRDSAETVQITPTIFYHAPSKRRNYGSPKDCSSDMETSSSAPENSPMDNEEEGNCSSRQPSSST